MDWSKFFEFYFQIWVITLPLTFYLFFSILKWIIHFLDYLINYDRIKYIRMEISGLDFKNEKNKITQNIKSIENDNANLKIFESLLSDPNKTALGSDVYENIRKIIR